jgi:hypothetical protein
MNALGQFAAQDSVNHTLALKTRLSSKRGRAHRHAKVGSTALSPAGVTLMAMAFVHDRQRIGLKRLTKFSCDPFGHAIHDAPHLFNRYRANPTFQPILSSASVDLPGQ